MERLLRQIEEWNKTREFSRAISAIEAIPEGERGYTLTLWLGRLYSNLAVLGDHGQRTYTDGRGRTRQTDQSEELRKKALEIFRSIQGEGQNDPVWNSRMAYALGVAEDRRALEYARRWLELAPEDPEARKCVEYYRRFLGETTKGKKKY